MPHITTWEGLLVASGRDELIGNFDHYTKPDLSYANREIKASVRPIYPWCPEPVEPTPFEVNKEVVSIQDHNRFNPGPFQEGSAIFPGHGVIAEDHSAGGFRDSLTGEGRPTKIWTNGGASTFEDRLALDFDANDAVFDMRQNIGGTAGLGGSTYMTETFEPLAGMNSFGESLNPVLEIGTKWCPGGPPLANGLFEMPTDNVGGSADPGGDDI